MQTELVQREADKKWVLYGHMPDPTEDPADWVGREMLFPMKWVALKVYDVLIELEEKVKNG